MGHFVSSCKQIEHYFSERARQKILAIFLYAFLVIRFEGHVRRKAPGNREKEMEHLCEFSVMLQASLIFRAC